MSAALQFLNMSGGAGNPLLSLTPEMVRAIAIQAAAEQGNFNLWWKAAIGFCVAFAVSELLEKWGLIRWMLKHRWAYYLAFREPPKDNKANEDNKEKNAPPETGK
jgi:hypothetical protein